jgi:hypothetical protein
MVLSEDGDHPMTRLSDTQLVILSAAAQRTDLSVLPLPDSLNLKGGALNKVMDSLRNRGLIRVIGGDGGPERVVITSEGMTAIGVEPEGTEEPTDGTAVEAPQPASEADGATGSARRSPRSGPAAAPSWRA